MNEPLTRPTETPATKSGGDLFRVLVRSISRQLGNEEKREEKTLAPKTTKRKSLTKAELAQFGSALEEAVRVQDGRRAMELLHEAGPEGAQSWWDFMIDLGQMDAKALPIACTVALARKTGEDAIMHLENGWKVLSESGTMLARTQVGARTRQEAIARFVDCMTSGRHLDNNLALSMLTTLMRDGDLDGAERVLSCKGRDKDRHAFFLSCNKLVQEHGDPLAEEIRMAWQGTNSKIRENLTKILLVNARDKSPHKNWQALLMEKYQTLPYAKKQDAGRKAWDWLLDIASVKHLDATQAQNLSECMDGLLTPGLMMLDTDYMVRKLEHALAGGNKNALILAKHLLRFPNITTGTDALLMQIVQRLGREQAGVTRRHLEGSLEALLREGHLFGHAYLAGQKRKWKNIGLEINERAREAQRQQGSI